ncbi:MAG: hypothetical protein AB8B91_17035 [Rubripirellula sp.]
MRHPRLFIILCLIATTSSAFAAGGSLTVSAREESDEEPTITRMQIVRADAPKKRIPIRKTVSAGIGVVLDRECVLSLPDAAYQFRMIRGPEYRIITGTFSLERTSLDDHSVALPRMVHMLEKGWTSGDCCVPASPMSLPLRMASEDLHLAAVMGHVDAKPIPSRDRDDPIANDPAWIREDVQTDRGLIFFGAGEPTDEDARLPVQKLLDVAKIEDAKIAVENPFAWQLPVWLASQKIDGYFVLGDWLRLDRKIIRVKNGRPVDGPSVSEELALGRFAERIYWNLLDAGLRIPLLAGTGDEAANTPVGYNRLYVANQLDDYEQDGKLEAHRVVTPEQWWHAAWQGQSIATNGPLLRPKLGGQIPGHVFEARTGEVLQLQPELTLSTRDPVDYLEVIHNGRVHYSARLDEFAKAGGKIPPLAVKESGWVTIRVQTLFEDHFRAAMSSPWYIDFDGQRRITARGVGFFQKWLTDYEQRLKRLPAAELKPHVPFVRAAREFWAAQAEQVTVE